MSRVARDAVLLQAIRSGYVRHVPKTMMEFEANPDFYKGKPEIERVVLKFGPDTPLLELLSGKVDAAGFAPTQIPGLGEDPRFRVYYSERNDNWAQWIFWNQRHPLFHDPVVRRALTLAINRRELLEVLNFPPDLPIFDVLFTRPQYRQRQLPEPLPYDPELAKQLLEAAGWQDEDGDGIRERAGAEARFTLIANRQSTVDLGERAAVYVQDQLRRVGIGMEVQILDRSLKNQRVRAGEFDAAFHLISRHWFRILPSNWFGEGSPLGYHNKRLTKAGATPSPTRTPHAGYTEQACARIRGACEYLGFIPVLGVNVHGNGWTGLAFGLR